MSGLLKRLEKLAEQYPDNAALTGPQQTVLWRALLPTVEKLSQKLQPYKGQVVALLSDNTIDWVMADLACLNVGAILLPIPGFFSVSQRQHTLLQSQASVMIAPVSAATPSAEFLTKDLVLIPLGNEGKVQIPSDTAKITFTSGSTGQPKGVCLSEQNQITVADALLERTGLKQGRHLCVLPLSTLLENIAGVYAPLLSGGEVILLPASEVGFNGAQGFDITRLITAIDTHQPDSLILLPELLSALLMAIEKGWQVPACLQFVAVGGSRVAAALLEQAQAAGLPVFEGYGLSECSSVVSLNSAEDKRSGSAGKPLSHIALAFDNGEIIVSGNAFLGYVNDPPSWNQDSVRTGDLGFVDDEGFLRINGRSKNLLINSFGRNINPEWVESEIMANPAIAQIVVFGDARPFCIALIQTRQETLTDRQVDLWLDKVNQSLPVYAQIHQWLRLQTPLSQADGTLTASGKPVRHKIAEQYQTEIDELYRERA